MKIAHIFADNLAEANSSIWRGKIIQEALRRAGHNATLVHVDVWMKDIRRSELHDADLIVVERVMVEESVDRAKYWQARGKAVVVDIDDAYHLLQPYAESGNQAAKFWREGEVDISYSTGIKFTKKLEVAPLEQFRRAMGYCAGLTMPSRVLAEDWRLYAPCWYVPNYIDQERYLPFVREKPNRPDEIVIGWGGSMSHKISFEKSGVALALPRVLRQRPQAKVLICGDERIVNIIKCPPSQVYFQHYVTWREWPRCVARMDIGLAPLHGRYDHSRSAIKSIEYSTIGIPFIATGCPTYQDFMDAGCGWYVNDGPDTQIEIERRADEWESKLLDMIDHYADYKAQMDAKFEYAQEWWVDNRAADVAKTYGAIIGSAK